MTIGFVKLTHEDMLDEAVRYYVEDLFYNLKQKPLPAGTKIRLSARIIRDEYRRIVAENGR